MGLIQAITEFLESLFNRNSPEVQKRLKLKKIDAELRAYNPPIFKNGLVLPNFAEAVRILYDNTKPLGELLSCTLGSPDAQQAARFESQLVITGFPAPEQKMLSGLTYEGRMEEFDNTSLTTSQIFDGQQRRLDKIINELHADTFKTIDAQILTARQLADFCKFSFITILQIFDPNFVSTGQSAHNPSFTSVPVGKIVNILEDLYFVTKGLSLTSASVNILTALAQLRGNLAAEKYTESVITDSLKNISYVVNHILTAEKIRMLICYAKVNINYIPKSADYKGAATLTFSEMLQGKFKSEGQRIKTEMKDNKISHEISGLFGAQALLTLEGYNDQVNARLIQNSAPAFAWVLPMRILKTFVQAYLNGQVRSLLNDIIVEGFFNNPSYKSDFSEDVFAVMESEDHIRAFEGKFLPGKPYAVSNIEGYLKDIHKEPSFMKQLEQFVNGINTEAGKIITREVNAINQVSKHVAGILQDSKKSTSENIENLKVLMMSPRNKDNTYQLESQYPSWQIFFDIMRNYAIIQS